MQSIRWNTEAAHEEILALCAGTWRRFTSLAQETGLSQVTLRKRLNELTEDLRVMTRRVKVNRSWLLEYQSTPPGFIHPLYEGPADARPLAECWQGYTFVATKHQSGAQQCRA